MSILDSFYILFKTNAKDVEKDVKSAQKATDDFQKEINKTDETTAKLGLSFSKLALAGIAALEGFASLGKLKSAIGATIDYNAQIEKASKLTGVASRELSIWTGAVARAGGDPGSKGFLDYITQLNKKYADLGINDRIKNVTKDLKAQADQIKSRNDLVPGSGYAYAQKLGIPDDVYLLEVNGGEELERNILRERELNNETQELTASAFELKQEWQDVGTQARSAFNSIQDSIRPVLVVLNDLLFLVNEIIDGFKLIKGYANFLGGAAAGAVQYLYDPAKGKATLEQTNNEWNKRKQDVANDTAGRLDYLGKYNAAQPGVPGRQSDNAAQSRAFWLAQGYTPAQVSALLANEQAEGGFASNAVGDNGQAQGLFQWHAARRAKILAATGIDVSTASHADQLRAAAWELQQTGTADRLRASSTPEAGASILTGYEAPANAAQQAYLRGQSADGYFAKLFGSGQTAISAADQSPLNSPVSNSSSQKSLNIGAVTINTQATDAPGISKAIGDHLANMWDTAIQGNDDGRLL